MGSRVARTVPRRVSILMGSDSDLPVMAECARTLEEYGLGYEIKVLSAHRTPEHTVRYVRRAERNGCRVMVAGAGASAHLAGVVAAHTLLPVIGVPLAGSPLGGFDALLSTVQMPPGVPVATVGVGAMGARNAGHLAASILALGDARLRKALHARRLSMRDGVLAKGRGLETRLRKLLAG
jgi:phosphoribosylaminoimidazole carboxylase PurE protein